MWLGLPNGQNRKRTCRTQRTGNLGIGFVGILGLRVMRFCGIMLIHFVKLLSNNGEGMKRDLDIFRDILLKMENLMLVI